MISTENNTQGLNKIREPKNYKRALKEVKKLTGKRLKSNPKKVTVEPR